MSTLILVPVKEHGSAKSRMSPVLAPDERAALAAAMFEDVARALAALGLPVTVVTNSGPTARRAKALQWRVIREARQISESASVDEACVRLRREGIESVLRLPADVPLVTAYDLEEILTDALPAPFTVLVPSSDRQGTNAVLRRPPDLFPARFGHNSLVLHVQEAMRAQAQIRILENRNIALDLDDISDIRRFLGHPSETFTHRLLTRLGIGERIDRRGMP